MAVYAEGLVVIPRFFRTEGPGGRPGRPREGWTKHLETCRHALRAHEALPAPAEDYPDTIECGECHPSDPHRYTAVQLDDGSWRTTCVACDLVGTGRHRRSAEDRIYREHTYARSAAAVAEARAGLAAGEQLMVIAPRQYDQGGWTLHREACAFAQRAKELWPAPEQPRPGTVDCTCCTPSTKHFTTYSTDAVGKHVASCLCGHTTPPSPSKDGARFKMVRMHRDAPDGPGA